MAVAVCSDSLPSMATMMARPGTVGCSWFDNIKVRAACDAPYTGSHALPLKPPMARPTVPLAPRLGEKQSLVELHQRCAALENRLGTDGACPDLARTLRRLEQQSEYYAAHSTSLVALLTELETELDGLLDCEDAVRRRSEQLQLRAVRNVQKYAELVAPAQRLLRSLEGCLALELTPLEPLVRSVAPKADIGRLETALDDMELRLQRHWQETLQQLDDIERLAFRPPQK